MNLNLINLDCTEWSKNDWRDAYAEYCTHNAYGPKTKKEYYDFVNARFNRLKSVAKPLSDELLNKWTNGFKNASVWAKKRKCNINGELLENSRPQIDIDVLAENVKDIQWQLMTKEQ